MKITRVSVDGLFGNFNHTIDLNLDDRITIIHGPNGVGKTTILKLINALFTKQGDEIRRIPFKELRIEFNDGSFFTIIESGKKELRVDALRNRRIEKKYKLCFKNPKSNVSKNGDYTLRIDPREPHFPLSLVERIIPQLNRIDLTEWIDESSGDILTLEKVLKKYGNLFPREFRELSQNWPEWFDEYMGDVSIRFIQAQRLLLLGKDNNPPREYYRYSDEKKPQVSDAVLNYSMQLKNLIQQKLAESSTLSQSLDRTFPQRLIENYKNKDLMPIDELNFRLNEVEKKTKFLISVGLYDPEKESIKNPIIENKQIHSVLSVYVEDREKKLEIYDDLAGKIALLEKLIQSRFKYKKIRIDKESGFVFETEQGILSPSNLSSGEQHELVLIYELLFLTSKDTLVLIDEPELSLHVGWQIRFLDDLQDIIKKTDIDALIATHSPQIINNRWDLTRTLGGK